MTINIDAAKIVSNWFQSRTFNDSEVSCAIRVPNTGETTNKATVTFTSEKILGSFTVWGNGCVEWLLVSASDGDLLVSRDSQFESDADVVKALEVACTEITGKG